MSANIRNCRYGYVDVNVKILCVEIGTCSAHDQRYMTSNEGGLKKPVNIGNELECVFSFFVFVFYF